MICKIWEFTAKKVNYGSFPGLVMENGQVQRWDGKIAMDLLYEGEAREDSTFCVANQIKLDELLHPVLIKSLWLRQRYLLRGLLHLCAACGQIVLCRRCRLVGIWMVSHNVIMVRTESITGRLVACVSRPKVFCIVRGWWYADSHASLLLHVDGQNVVYQVQEPLGPLDYNASAMVESDGAVLKEGGLWSLKWIYR